MWQDEKFWHVRRVALTGATGFIGHHTTGLLRRLGAEVIALVRNSSAQQRLEQQGIRCVVAALDNPADLARGCDGADVLIHLAGAVDMGNDWQRCQQVNVLGTRNVLQAARSAGVRRVVHVSSIVAVGASRRPDVLDESAEWNLGELQLAYATTKRQGELAALLDARCGQDVVVVNPGCVIGPDDVSGSEFGTLCRRFWRGRIPFYFAGGLSIVDVRDVAMGIQRAAQYGQAGRRYLLTGHNLRQGEFFTALARCAGRFYPRMRLPCLLGRFGAALADRWQGRGGRRPYLSAAQARALGLYFFYDCNRARQHLGFSPRPLFETLADTHAFWCRSHESHSGPVERTRVCMPIAVSGQSEPSA
jgi:dihydroflavonol-4-reductase